LLTSILFTEIISSDKDPLKNMKLTIVTD